MLESPGRRTAVAAGDVDHFAECAAAAAASPSGERTSSCLLKSLHPAGVVMTESVSLVPPPRSKAGRVRAAGREEPTPPSHPFYPVLRNGYIWSGILLPFLT